MDNITIKQEQRPDFSPVHGIPIDCKTRIEVVPAPRTRKRKIELCHDAVCDGPMDSALKYLSCGGYDMGCCCMKCIRTWSGKEPWKKGPRCIMCPAMCNEAGLEYDGVCGNNCKMVLCELMKGRATENVNGGSYKPTGYPFGIFKKTRWAEVRGDMV